jgi:hypothetical protein
MGSENDSDEVKKAIDYLDHCEKAKSEFIKKALSGLPD